MFVMKLILILSDTLPVADRNGSLETNESSSPEVSPHNSDPELHSPSVTSAMPDFDFNDFFKIENIPGLSVSYVYFGISLIGVLYSCQPQSSAANSV